MTDRRVGTITVNPRTIDLAGEILVISQIVRLRELDYEFRRGMSGGRFTLLVLGVLLFFFGSSLLRVTSSSGSPTLTSFVGLVAVVGVLLYSFHPKRRFILAIEVASGSMSGLYAKHSMGLTNLKEAIQQVIENPPHEPTSLHVGDVYTVDARGVGNAQFGRDNKQTIN